jgi:transcription termination/antitermination protein NusA
LAREDITLNLPVNLVGYEIDVFRDLDAGEDEDVDLDEFVDEIDGWVIDELKRVGLDTAKSVLALPKEDILRRTDLEEETVEEVLIY